MVTGPKFTGDPKMENGKTETEEMIEGGSEGQACF